MTVSVLSAAIFSLMCYALPTASGHPVLTAPTPERLAKVQADTSSDDPDSGSEIFVDNAKTLILGQQSSRGSEAS